MASCKVSSLCLVLMVSIIPHVTATQQLGIITEEISKNNPKALKLNGPYEMQELTQLKNKEIKKLSLHQVYEVHKKNDTYINKGPISISPEMFNPDVEELSLTVCGLGPKQVKRIGEFKKLRKLVLNCNPLTDESIRSITLLEDLNSLSLFSTNITNSALKEILKMPNLIELDVRQNEGITDEMADDLLKANKLKVLRVAGTGLSRNIQRQIERNQKR